jgi:hypothetical protein
MIDPVRSPSASWLSPLRLVRRRPATAVQGFWYGDPLAPLHWACLNSFIEKGLGFDLYTYQELTVPKGVRLRDAAEIIPREGMFFFPNPHTRQPDVAPFSDYFRLFVLQMRGGWWCDVDTICLTSDLPAGDRVWARQSPEYRPESVSNGQLHFAKGDSLLEVLIEEATNRKGAFPRRESLGPELFTTVLNRLALPLDMGATADTFYPVRFIEAFKLWLPEFRDEVQERTEGAVFLPVYQSFPTRFGFANDRLPPKGSFLRKFLRKHAPQFDGPCYGADEFRAAVRLWFNANPKFLPQLRSVCEPDIETWLKSGKVRHRNKTAGPVTDRRGRGRRRRPTGG